jgi:endonuclease YncB( thermonuclease family)
VLIHNREPRIHCQWGAEGKLVRLMPGINEVEQADFEVMRKNQIFGMYVKAGALEVLEQVTDKQSAVKSLSNNEAARLVAETADRELLTKWLEGEQRKPVREAIEKQFARLAELDKAAEKARQ